MKATKLVFRRTNRCFGLQMLRQRAHQLSRARPAIRISTSAGQKTATRDSAKLLVQDPLFNVLFHVAHLPQRRPFRWFHYAVLPSRDCRRAVTCCSHVAIWLQFAKAWATNYHPLRPAKSAGFVLIQKACYTGHSAPLHPQGHHTAQPVRRPFSGEV
jgi:hypothetical protein